MRRSTVVPRGAIGLALLLAALAISLTLAAPARALPVQAGTPAPAAANSCAALIPSFSKAREACSDLNANVACYGLKRSDSVAKGAPKESLRFSKPKDREQIVRFQTIRTLKDKSAVGAAIMRLQLSTETAPVNAILFGDSQLQPQDKNGSQIYRLSASGGKLVCDRTPPGLAVSTDTGQTGRLTVNGVEIVLGSTAFLTQVSPSEMVVVNVAGSVSAAIPGVTGPVAIPAAQQVSVTYAGQSPVSISEPVPSPLAESALLLWWANAGAPGIQDPNTEAIANVPACGGSIAFGQTVEQAITRAGQECLFKLCANAGDVVTARMERTSGNLDPHLDLLRPDKLRVKWNDDVSASNQNSTLCNLPVDATSCDHVLVARSFSNASTGGFRLTVERQNDNCAVTPNCLIVGQDGVNLRSGPGVGYSRLTTLPVGAKLLRDQGSAAGWLAVQAQPGGQRGWVSASPALVVCDDPVSIPAAPGSPGSSGDSGNSGTSGGVTPAPPPPPAPPPATPTPDKGGPFPAP